MVMNCNELMIKREPTMPGIDALEKILDFTLLGWLKKHSLNKN